MAITVTATKLTSANTLPRHIEIVRLVEAELDQQRQHGPDLHVEGQPTVDLFVLSLADPQVAMTSESYAARAEVRRLVEARLAVLPWACCAQVHDAVLAEVDACLRNPRSVAHYKPVRTYPSTSACLRCKQAPCDCLAAERIRCDFIVSLDAAHELAGAKFAGHVFSDVRTIVLRLTREAPGDIDGGLRRTMAIAFELASPLGWESEDIAEWYERAARREEVAGRVRRGEYGSTGYACLAPGVKAPHVAS